MQLWPTHTPLTSPRPRAHNSRTAPALRANPSRNPLTMSPPRHINIGPYSFPVTPGYSDGARSVGGAELEVLDVARAERVRKKGFKVLEKLRAKSGRRTLSEGELRHLTEQIAAFDREVDLAKLPDPRGIQSEKPTRLAAPSGGPEGFAPDLNAGEFDAEVATLAERRVAAEEATRGITLTEAQRTAAITALREDPALRESARVRVEVALRERDKMLSELF